MNIWSMLAGAGVVAGTGGIGGVAWLAFKGLGAIAAARRVRMQGNGGTVAGGNGGSVQPIQHPIQQSIQNPQGTPNPVIQQPNPSVIQLPPQQWDGRLAPHDVRFVQVPNDFRKASIDFALEQTARRYPGSVHTLEAFVSMVNQHLQATGHGQDSLIQ